MKSWRWTANSPRAFRLVACVLVSVRAPVAVADQVPPLRLGARNADRPQLGWNTWLRGRNDPRPANDSEFHFSAMGGQSWH